MRSMSLGSVIVMMLALGCGGPEDKNFPPLSDTGVGGSFPGPSAPGGPITSLDAGDDDATDGATAAPGGDEFGPTEGTTAATTDLTTVATEDTLPDATIGDATIGDATFGDEADDDATTLTTGPLTTG